MCQVSQPGLASGRPCRCWDSGPLRGAVGAAGFPQSGGRGVSLLLDQTPQGPWCPLLSPQPARLLSASRPRGAPPEGMAGSPLPLEFALCPAVPLVEEDA